MTGHRHATRGHARRLPLLLAAMVALSTSLFLACAAQPVAAAVRQQSVAPWMSGALQQGSGLPIFPASLPNTPPPGFTSTAAQAITAAEHTPQMQALHKREHPLFVRAFTWGNLHWWINFWKGNTTVAEVDVNKAGRVTGVWIGAMALAVYAHGHYMPLFDAWYVVIPFSLLFLLPFLDWRRLRRLVHLDALVLLSFLISYELFDHAHLVPAVWMVYPPLVYLLARMAAIGLRRGPRAPSTPAPSLSIRVLAAGLLCLVGARIALCFIASGVTDVGYASVTGAHHILHGLPLYQTSAGHTDTYGPIAYLAYVPFELIWPWHGQWDYLMSAHVASIMFDLVTIAALVLLGRRLRPGREGVRLGLALGWVFAACPFTLLALIGHTNDGLVAMLSVLGLLVFASPAARGAMLGLAAAAKFSPAALLPLYARPRKGRRGAAFVVLACALIVVFAIGLYLPSGGVSQFYHETLGYQFNRPDVFSPWALHPSLDPIKTLLAAAAVLFAGALAFVPRERTMAQLCALAAAVTIAVQIPAVHWFYYYIVWFIPFVAVALLARPGERTIPSTEVEVDLDAVPVVPLAAAEVVPIGAGR